MKHLIFRVLPQIFLHGWIVLHFHSNIDELLQALLVPGKTFTLHSEVRGICIGQQFFNYLKLLLRIHFLCRTWHTFGPSGIIRSWKPRHNYY